MEELRAIANSIGPSSDTLLWDITLYVLFFLNLIMLLLLPDGSTVGTLLSMAVLISIFIDKTYAFGYMIDPGPYTPETCHSKVFIGTYLIRAIIFAAPLTIAASTNEGRVRGAAIVAGIGGAIYMFLRWFMEQRDFNAPDIICFNTSVAAQSIGMVFILARVALRDRLRLGRIDRHVPVTIAGDFAPDHVEVELA